MQVAGTIGLLLVYLHCPFGIAKSAILLDEPAWNMRLTLHLNEARRCVHDFNLREFETESSLSGKLCSEGEHILTVFMTVALNPCEER